jgi:hypothetical protein
MSLAENDNVVQAFPSDRTDQPLTCRCSHRPVTTCWIREVKFDGYRVLIRIANEEVKVLTCGACHHPATGTGSISVRSHLFSSAGAHPAQAVRPLLKLGKKSKGRGFVSFALLKSP